MIRVGSSALCALLLVTGFVAGCVDDAAEMTVRVFLPAAAASCRAFRAQEGRWPTSSEEVLQLCGSDCAKAEFRDGWSRPVILERAEGQLLIRSLGRDGVRDSLASSDDLVYSVSD